MELRFEVFPWANSPAAPPPAHEFTLACIYDLDLGVDSLPEAAWFRRHGDYDELWAAMVDEFREPYDAVPLDAYLPELTLRVRAPRGGPPATSASRLFRHLIRSRTGFGWPVRWFAGWLIDKPAFEENVETVASGLKRNSKAAKRHESPIVRKAKQLGLAPAPTGTSPTTWSARCPGTNHHLYISTTSDTFGCGWCRRKGGRGELEAFVNERLDKQGRR